MSANMKEETKFQDPARMTDQELRDAKKFLQTRIGNLQRAEDEQTKKEAADLEDNLRKTEKLEEILNQCFLKIFLMKILLLAEEAAIPVVFFNYVMKYLFNFWNELIEFKYLFLYLLYIYIYIIYNIIFASWQKYIKDDMWHVNNSYDKPASYKYSSIHIVTTDMSIFCILRSLTAKNNIKKERKLIDPFTNTIRSQRNRNQIWLLIPTWYCVSLNCI